MVDHIAHQLLPPLIVAFKDPVDVYNRGLSWELFYARINLDFFFVDVLLYPSHVVVSCMEIVSPCKPLVLCTLLLNVVLSILHVDKHLFELLMLFVSL